MTNHDNERGGSQPTQIHQVTETPETATQG